MIVTLTMNPSIDISYPLEHFQLNEVNRVQKVTKTPGGKGLNVTRVLHQLKDDVLASGLIGGTLGKSIQEELNKMDISHDFFQIKGETRNCIAILHEGMQTEILESGPEISVHEAENFLTTFEQLVNQGDIFVFSGSLPKGLDKNFYSQMITLCQKKNKKVILDCSGETLKASITGENKPFLIKPNTSELSELLGKKIPKDLKVLKEELSASLFSGIPWIVVSLGEDGAFAKHENKFYKVDIPKISVVNPVGSGDSTIAGLASGIYHGESDEDVLKKANVLGMLNAQETLTGHVNLNHYDQLFKQIKVRQV